MSDRTEQISHISILFRAIVFTIILALISGGIDAKRQNNRSDFHFLSKTSKFRLIHESCYPSTCNLGDSLPSVSHSQFNVF